MPRWSEVLSGIFRWMMSGHLLPQDDVHQSRYVADVHRAVVVHVGCAVLVRTLAKDDVHQSGHVADVHAAVTVHVARDGSRFLKAEVVKKKIKSTKKCLQGLPRSVFPCFCKLLINIYFQ